MKTAGLFLLAAALILAIFSIGPAEDARFGEYKISGPYNHENLTVFFLHGSDLVQSEDLMPLGQALEESKVIVHETGNVQELTIENISGCPVFIHAGDIVKGGRQDRVIRVDVILKPHSGKRPISSFCVESGRWSQRGDENPAAFEGSYNMVASKDLKMAAKVSKSQTEVWNKVDEMQVALGDNLGVAVRGGRSPSSLQLTLENDKVKLTTQEYIDAMTKEMEKHNDILGFAFAINGEINSADIYRSHDLFVQLWPKLIEACAIEAVSSSGGDATMSSLTAQDIAEWMDQAQQGETEQSTINERTGLNTIENNSDIIFETMDKENDQYIHRNILKR
jgi:hypothetical protein